MKLLPVSHNATLGPGEGGELTFRLPKKNEKFM